MEMDALVGTYSCEWTEVVNDPERRKKFRQFVNAVSAPKLSIKLTEASCGLYKDETALQIEPIVERGQTRPADWPKEFPSMKLEDSHVPAPKDQWKWKALAKVTDFSQTNEGTTYVV